jgi:hypothetical protein
MFNYSIPFLLARLAIGTSFFGHGLVRIPILSSYESP